MVIPIHDENPVRRVPIITYLLIALNLTPVPRHGYILGVPQGGQWAELLNSDAPLYGGSGQGNLGGVTATDLRAHGRDHSLSVTLPPLGMVMFKRRA